MPMLAIKISAVRTHILVVTINLLDTTSLMEITPEQMIPFATCLVDTSKGESKFNFDVLTPGPKYHAK